MLYLMQELTNFQFHYFCVVFFLRGNKVCGDQDGERKVARVRDRAVSESGIGQEGHQYPFPVFSRVYPSLALSNGFLCLLILRVAF